MAAKAPMGEDGGRAAKRRKVAPFAEQGAGRPKWMKQDDSRERRRLGRQGRTAARAAGRRSCGGAAVAGRRSRRAGAGADGDRQEMKKKKELVGPTDISLNRRPLN